MKVISMKKLLRRGTALLLAIPAILALSLGVTATSAEGERSTSDRGERLTVELLKWELGDPQWESLPWPVRILGGQSALLRANLSARSVVTEDASEAPVETSAQMPESLPDAQPAPDRDDLQEEPQTTTAPENIVERTLIPSSAEGYVTGAGLYLYNRTSRQVDLARAVGAELSFTLEPASEGPQILIVHTHTSEAYTPDGTDIYTPSDENSRTLEEEYNMLRVGDELERVFTEMGLSVLHDRGVYDYPRYNGAYSRSGESVEDYLEQYPTIRLVLDVHRDALEDGNGTVYKTVTTVDGAKTAQVMLVVGTDETDPSHTHWQENLALAARLQKSLDTLYPTLARPITLRSSSYNQDLSPGFLLVEVGSHGNTLQEALAGARCFARAAGAVFLGLTE